MGAESGWLGGWLRRWLNLERILHSSEADSGATGWGLQRRKLAGVEGRTGQRFGGHWDRDSSIQNLTWLAEGEMLSMGTID